MITVEQTIKIIKENIPERTTEKINLPDALGRVLAEEIVSPIDSPTYNNSAMDGFAARWQDVEAAREHEVSLKISGESSAGHPFDGILQKETAIRISTGAIVPESADCIIPIEKCRVDTDTVTILSVHKKNQHIRFAGEEFQKGRKLLDPAIRIGSAQVALLASLGIKEVSVYQKPRVAIMTTGSELVAFDQSIQSHQLRDSNTPMLSAAVMEAGGQVVRTFHAKDDPGQTQHIIETAAKEARVIISSGGVSMGVHDHIRDTALKTGFKELFWKIKQKPGKPMFLAKRDETLLIALPGNPVSAYICFKHYVRPMLQNAAGHDFNWSTVKAKTTKEIVNSGDRKQLLRVRFLDKDQDPKPIEALSKQGSHMPSTIAHADGYIILAEGQRLAAESNVDVYLLD